MEKGMFGPIRKSLLKQGYLGGPTTVSSWCLDLQKAAISSLENGHFFEASIHEAFETPLRK